MLYYNGILQIHEIEGETENRHVEKKVVGLNFGVYNNGKLLIVAPGYSGKMPANFFLRQNFKGFTLHIYVSHIEFRWDKFNC